MARFGLTILAVIRFSARLPPMKRLLAPGFLLLSLLVPFAHAQDDTAHHRKVYAEINDHEASYKKVKALHRDEPLEFELLGYYDGSTLRKIVARIPGEDGDGSDEYYIENGEPLFVFNHYQTGSIEPGKPKRNVENRLYFKDGKMFKWINTDKKSVPADSPDFISEAERLTSNYNDFLAAFKNKGGPVKREEIKTAEGIFTGIEQGDYAHWLMKTKDGKKLSFFILDCDATVDKVIENTKAYAGKKCRIQWKESLETIPEAGGKMKIEQVISVEWPDKR